MNESLRKEQTEEQNRSLCWTLSVPLSLLRLWCPHLNPLWLRCAEPTPAFTSLIWSIFTVTTSNDPGLHDTICNWFIEPKYFHFTSWLYLSGCVWLFSPRPTAVADTKLRETTVSRGPLLLSNRCHRPWRCLSPSTSLSLFIPPEVLRQQFFLILGV